MAVVADDLAFFRYHGMAALRASIKKLLSFAGKVVFAYLPSEFQ
jgi:hypothetical protein